MSTRTTLARTGGVAALALLLVSGPSAARAASVEPVLAGANPTCQQLGYDHGFKPNAGGAEGTPGTFTDTVTGASITWSHTDGTPNSVTWTSSVPADAVVVKGGDGAHVYAYEPPSRGDSGLVTPGNAGGQPPDVSHVQFCFTFNVTVTKTAGGTYTRTYGWSVDKTSPTTTLTLAAGQSHQVDYTVTATRDAGRDSDHAVAGTITVTNPWPTAATLVSVTDSLPGAVVDCDGAATVPPRGHIGCTYTAPVGSAADGLNTATATVSFGSGDRTASGSAPYSFGAPTTEVDECASVADDRHGSLDDSTCATTTYPYAMTVGPYAEAGTYTFTNTATCTPLDTAAAGCTDTHTVTITVPASGCTLTQGYWKTHSQHGPAPYDDTWALLASAQDTAFFGSGQSWHEVFWTSPSGGNGYYVLAHQYMAATLNVLNGAASTAAVTSAITQATAIFGAASGTSLGGALNRSAKSLAATLAAYNEGTTGPGHCSE